LAWFRPLIRFFAEWETGVSVDQVRPEAVIDQISPRPVLIIQGLADTVVPPNSGERLYAAAGEPCTLWDAAHVGHVGMIDAYPQEYEQRVIGFFDQAFGLAD